MIYPTFCVLFFFLFSMVQYGPILRTYTDRYVFVFVYTVRGPSTDSLLGSSISVPEISIERHKRSLPNQRPNPIYIYISHSRNLVSFFLLLLFSKCQISIYNRQLFLNEGAIARKLVVKPIMFTII